jgi:membrane protease subunit HflC
MNEPNRIQELLNTLTGKAQWVWPAAVAMTVMTVGAFSIAEIQPGEAGCRINNLTGTQESITQPGWVTRVPIVHSLYLEDASPQTFTMTGNDDVDALHSKMLTVRASDGSNFSFDSADVIFQLQGDQVCPAIEDSGIDNGYRDWMIPYVRTVMRDEFGRESTINVSDPTKYAASVKLVSDRLNEVLGAHAISVNQLVTPKPRFNDQYEKAIEDRNGLENKKAVIRSSLDRAETDRERQLAIVDQEKNLAMQERRATLENSLATASAQQAAIKQGADTHAIVALGEGQAYLSGKEGEAAELQGELAATFESKQAEISAFRNQPVERVMQRLGEKLAGVTISIQPWANDSTPSKVELQK